MVGSRAHIADEAALLRKMRKPMVEKKRRDRMNVSIDKLKALLAMSADDATAVVKMEKAEILELAVAHLTELQKTSHVTSYIAGFRQCKRETIRFLNTSAMMHNPLLNDLDNHLHNIYESISRKMPVHLSSATSGPSVPSERYSVSPTPMTSAGHIPPPSLPLHRPTTPSARNLVFSPIPKSDPPFASTPRSTCRADTPSPFSSTTCSSDLGYWSSCVSLELDESSLNKHGISKDDLVLRDVVKEERPWRPW